MSFSEVLCAKLPGLKSRLCWGNHASYSRVTIPKGTLSITTPPESNVSKRTILIHVVSLGKKQRCPLGEGGGILLITY